MTTEQAILSMAVKGARAAVTQAAISQLAAHDVQLIAERVGE